MPPRVASRPTHLLSLCSSCASQLISFPALSSRGCQGRFRRNFIFVQHAKCRISQQRMLLKWNLPWLPAEVAAAPTQGSITPTQRAFLLVSLPLSFPSSLSLSVCLSFRWSAFSIHLVQARKQTNFRALIKNSNHSQKKSHKKFKQNTQEKWVEGKRTEHWKEISECYNEINWCLLRCLSVSQGELAAVFTYVFGNRYSKNTFETVKYHRLLSDSTGTRRAGQTNFRKLQTLHLVLGMQRTVLSPKNFGWGYGNC